MTIQEVLLTEDVRWRIHRGDSAERHLQARPGWSFINPLVYPDVAREVNLTLGRYRYGALVGDSILIETNVLLFDGPDTGEHADDLWSVMETFVPLFLAHLRCLSNQTGLAHAHVGSGEIAGRQPVLIPDPILPPARPGESMWAMNYPLATAVSWGQVEQADVAARGGDPPLFASVLLDAVDAFLQRDDRRTILYAAMAVEIIARMKLHLTGTPERPYVHSLFHKFPLMARGRSLKSDDPDLFQLVSRLYQTRNDFVHQGTSLPRTAVLPPDGEGAFQALECANAVFEWFGENGGYMPAHGGVKAEVPVGHVPDFSRSPGLLPRAYQSALVREVRGGEGDDDTNATAHDRQ